METGPQLEPRVAQLEKMIESLKQRADSAERELNAWRRLTVAPESGGGQVYVGPDSVILRINSLTTTASQLP